MGCKDCGSPDKLKGRSVCKPCYNARRRERYANDPEYRTKRKEQVKKYQHGNGREKRREYERARAGAPGRTWKEWADKNGNRERKRKQERERYWTDPEFRKRKLMNALIRSRKTAKGDLTVQQWEEIVERYKGLCAYCDAPYEHLEHVIPLSRGGEHTASNVVPACASCNLAKGSKTPEEWRPPMAA